MAVSCDPDDLVELAKCFSCMEEKKLLALQTYLLAVIAGGSTDPDALVESAKCFLCLDENKLRAIQDYLLCQIANQ